MLNDPYGSLTGFHEAAYTIARSIHLLRLGNHFSGLGARQQSRFVQRPQVAIMHDQLQSVCFIAAALDCSTKSRAREIPRVFGDMAGASRELPVVFCCQV